MMYKLLIKMKNGEVLEFLTDITSINRLILCWGMRSKIHKNTTIEIVGQPIKIHDVIKFRYTEVDFPTKIFQEVNMDDKFKLIIKMKNRKILKIKTDLKTIEMLKQAYDKKRRIQR